MTARTDLVTGARGFIGGYLVRHLAQTGARVAGLGHGNWPGAAWPEAGLSDWQTGAVDFANLSMLAARAGGFGCIYHLAGGSSVAPSLAAPLEDFERSVLTVARLMDWVRLNAPETRVVLVSSAAVYGATASVPVTEEEPCAPISPYGAHKWAAEREAAMFAQQYGLSLSVVRLFSVYGPGLRKQLLWDLCSRIVEQKGPLLLGGTGAEQRDWLHVRDAARLIRMAGGVASPDSPIINGASGIAVPIFEIAALVAAEFDDAPDIRFSGQARPGDPQVMHADVTKARALGFQPEWQLTGGIAEYVRWFREGAPGR